MTNGVDIFQIVKNAETVAGVTDYAREVWQLFSFTNKNSRSVGNSTLKHQLQFPSNKDSRDCKLPTLVCAVGLRDAGYEVLMFSRTGGGHPYLVVRIEGDAYRIDFLAMEFRVCRYTRRERFYSWGSVLDINHQMKFQMQHHEFSRKGCESLDDNYIALVSEC